MKRNKRARTAHRDKITFWKEYGDLCIAVGTLALMAVSVMKLRVTTPEQTPPSASLSGNLNSSTR